jgi:hypothetical protein
MVIDTSGVRVAYLAETNYAGGNAGAKYAMTALSAGDVSALTVMNFPAAGPVLGIPETEWKKIRPLGRNAEYFVTFAKGYKYKEFKYTQYVQNNTWIQAIQQASGGTIPISYCFHFEIPGIGGALDYFDLFGCELQDYEFNMNGNEFPTETLTFSFYDLKASVAVTSLAPMNETQCSISDDIAITIDGDSIDTLTTATLKITNTFLDTFVGGKMQRFDPYLKSREASLQCEYLTDHAAIYGNSMASNGTLASLNLVDATIVVYTGGTTTIAEMEAVTDNLGELPEEMDMYTFKSTLETAGNSAISYA